MHRKLQRREIRQPVVKCFLVLLERNIVRRLEGEPVRVDGPSPGRGRLLAVEAVTELVEPEPNGNDHQ